MFAGRPDILPAIEETHLLLIAFLKNFCPWCGSPQHVTYVSEAIVIAQSFSFFSEDPLIERLKIHIIHEEGPLLKKISAVVIGGGEKESHARKGYANAYP